jgi:excisionase family DNA binding protein
MADDALLVDEVAEDLRVSRNQVLLLLRDGRMQGFKVGIQWRVTREALTNYKAGITPKSEDNKNG